MQFCTRGNDVRLAGASELPDFTPIPALWVADASPDVSRFAGGVKVGRCAKARRGWIGRFVHESYPCDVSEIEGL